MAMCTYLINGPKQRRQANRHSTYNMNFLGFMSKDKYRTDDYAMKVLKNPKAQQT